MQDRMMKKRDIEVERVRTPTELMTPRLEHAFRWAAECHQGQTRKGNSTPYFEHVAAVAFVLDRAGFEEDVVIAGLLHDVVEDTGASSDDVAARFGSAVAEIVGHCTEAKNDARGNKRPWIDRKHDHLAAMVHSPLPARAVMLADKLHNLITIEVDLHAGRDAWSQFSAPRAQVVWYYETAIGACQQGDARLEPLASACRDALERIGLLG
jgi:guanosine-3',5'-bis(diphosphate) 3'-pyrophosphohydrolase